MRDDLGGGLLDSLAVRANHEAAQAPIERARGVELSVDVRGIGVSSGNGKSKFVVQPALTDIVDDACGREQAVDARRLTVKMLAGGSIPSASGIFATW